MMNEEFNELWSIGVGFFGFAIGMGFGNLIRMAFVLLYRLIGIGLFIIIGIALVSGTVFSGSEVVQVILLSFVWLILKIVTILYQIFDGYDFAIVFIPIGMFLGFFGMSTKRMFTPKPLRYGSYWNLHD